nr:reverse transcriptase domain-containing protein [Tanacetum cinerariifolium]
MAGPEPITPLNEGTSSQNAKSIIEGHVSAIKEILKEPDNQNLIKPILLDFDDIQDVSDEEIKGGMKEKAKVGDEDLSKPFKERFSHGNNGRRQEHKFAARTAHPIHTATASRSRVPPTKSSLNLRFIVKHSLGNHNNGTPVVPAPTSAFGGSTQGKGGQQSNGPQKVKVINMVQCYSLNRKRKTTMTDEEWMNVPIIFPPVLARDHSKDALVVEVEVEGYLVRRIHIDEGASIEIMFEHCFNMLHPSIRSKVVKTQTVVSGFLGEQVKPLGKIELDVCLGGEGRSKGRSVHHSQDDEIPNSLGGSNSTIVSVGGFRMQKNGKEASDRTIRE